MNRKKLISILGLIAVIVITVVACFTPDANAENGQTTITVNVTAVKHPTVSITNPEGEEELMPAEFSISTDYTESDGLTVQLQKDDDTYDHVATLADEAGTFDILRPNIDAFTNPFGAYVIQATATGDSNTAVATKNVTLTSLRVSKNGHATTGDPIVHIVFDERVDHYSITIVNPDSETPFYENTGLDASDIGDGNIVIPFGEAGLTDGTYYPVKITAYGENDQWSEAKSVDCNYRPNSGPDDPDDPDRPEEPDDDDSPAVPDTGKFTEKLNVSQSDYAIALIASGVVTVILAIIFAKKRSEKR